MPPKIQMEPEPGDQTPEVGSATDVAPLGRGRAKPAHELTAEEEADAANWDAVAADPEFRGLLASKRRFIVPATVFFVVYYFALPVLVGYAPRLMETRVLGLNVAYLFALSQFVMAWAVAALYVRAAGGWDAVARRVVERLHAKRGEE
jgi:uncharacterized membrane protein (DUF485 family)